MLIATNGINTHKGAIWAMGLLISVIAQKISMEQPFFYRKYLMMSASLLLFLIQNIVIKTTHGHRVKQKYGVNGAYEEAILGYPHIRLAIQAAKELDNDSYVQKQMHMLLVLMSSLDDTCVLHRSDQKTLVEMQNLLMLLVKVLYQIVHLQHCCTLSGKPNLSWKKRRSLVKLVHAEDRGIMDCRHIHLSDVTQ